MKKLIISACLALAINLNAQTNPPTVSGGIEQIASAIGSSTNWTLLHGAGRALKGNRNIAFGDLVYNMNDNVGLVMGLDTLWAPNQSQQRQQNSVKGGITLKAAIHPFTFLGSTFLTNVIAQPFAAELFAQPTGGSADSVATITTVGINFDVVSFKNFELVAGAQYETRTGSGFWNGNYGLIHLGIGRRF